ncbi:MAG: tRNA-dihydrouridine synthase family protein [Verrucomicrobia bacterium]|nr:tRNA-dihydrouridine synthase family protein [Verrucomicrobiota bacterium]
MSLHPVHALPRYLAPMAGLTHSAFRRVVATLGGCDGFTTEMLSAKALLSDDFATSPYVKRSALERVLLYQLMLANLDPVQKVVGKVASMAVDGIDVNLACHAPRIRGVRAGSSLFLDRVALERTLGQLRAHWGGFLSVKVRLGSEGDGWEEVLRDRFDLFEQIGVDRITLHARFFEDKYKRRVRHELYPVVCGWTRLPMIANGDLSDYGEVDRQRGNLESVGGIMVGRMAVVQPWLFAHWGRGSTVEPESVWWAVADAVLEDFPEKAALGRLKLFGLYFSRNYLFGHAFAVRLKAATSIAALFAIASDFFARAPQRVDQPHLGGLA